MVARTKVVLGGTIGSGVEEWSTSIHYERPTDDVNAATLASWAASIKTLVGTIGNYPELKTLWSGSVALTTVTCYSYGASGPAEAVGQSGSAPLVGTGSATLPPQISVVATLRTGQAGRRYRGRMYWPAMGGDFGISSGQSFRFTGAQGVANDTADLLLAIGGAWPGTDDLIPVVYSAVADELTAVSTVSVGDVFDTQRRRRDDMLEVYADADV